MKFANFLLLVFPEILFENSPVASVLVKKQVKNTMSCTLWKNRYVFWKLSFFSGLFFLKFSLKSHLSPFVGQKTTKKHDVPCKKTVAFCENCRFFAGGFFWNSAWNLTFCLIFCQKTTKKTRYTLQKNRYVLRKLSFYYKGFSLQFCLKSYLLPFFLSKNN